MTGDTVIEAMRTPDAVFVWSTASGGMSTAAKESDGGWVTSSARVETVKVIDGLSVRVTSPSAGLSRVALRWRDGVHEDALVLGDAWERSYGDLGWQHVRPERVLPWYWLATSSGHYTRGAGVRVRPGAMSYWTVDTDGVTLWLDVRSGSEPVELGGRELEAATVVAISAVSDVSAFSAQKTLCAALCSDSRALRTPLVGANNWYYAYGSGFDAQAVVRDAALIVEAADGHVERPFSVIDAGWSTGASGAPGGPWLTGIKSFENMTTVADRIRAEGARPGLWMRPLLTSDRSSLTREEMLDGEWPLDPSRPEVLNQVRRDIQRLVSWGYELIKHDFSTFDTIGHFVPGTELGMEAVPWSFADRSRTTAEVVIGLYRAIREAAGDTIVIGCNTIGHLAAGLVEVQRIGDDTSGRQWERTRRMGVNTLAFRLAQHGAFFSVDADCVPSTPETPWEKNRQFLDLIAHSGTALFASIDPVTWKGGVIADVRRAVKTALDGGDPGGIEPLDWQLNSAPRRWLRADGEHFYDWSMPWGADSGLASI